MLGRSMIRTAVVLILVVAVAACDQGSGDPRCETELRAGSRLTMLTNGYLLDCAPAFPAVDPHTGRSITGWTDEAKHVVYLWPDELPGELLPKTALHEAGHTEWNRRTLRAATWRLVRGISLTTSDHAVEEDFAEVFSYCRHTYAVGYAFRAGRPTTTECTWATGLA